MQYEVAPVQHAPADPQVRLSVVDHKDHHGVMAPRSIVIALPPGMGPAPVVPAAAPAAARSPSSGYPMGSVELMPPAASSADAPPAYGAAPPPYGS
jgi:hypothetical protein